MTSYRASTKTSMNKSITRQLSIMTPHIVFTYLRLCLRISISSHIYLTSSTMRHQTMKALQVLKMSLNKTLVNSSQSQAISTLKIEEVTSLISAHKGGRTGSNIPLQDISTWMITKTTRVRMTWMSRQSSFSIINNLEKEHTFKKFTPKI
jgi:hypothetical protein